MRYFDYNATAPLRPEAREAWLAALEADWANPDSPHGPGARAHAHLEGARERLAGLLGCEPGELVFVSGATEANNAVFAHTARSAQAEAPVAVSAIEHPCVMEPARHHFGERLRVLPVDGEGRVQLEALDALLARETPALVAVMAANNETGVIQPWPGVSERCRAAGVPVLVDAAQWCGKEPAGELGRADFVTAAAHKFGGPLGIGLLKVPAGALGLRSLRGGEQEAGRRAGTSNYPAVAGMAAALEALEARLPEQAASWRARREAFEAALAEALPGVRVVGAGAERLANTASLITPLGDNLRWVRLLEREGFAVSTGSACATGKEGPSHVLAAMGFDAVEAARSVRVSGGPDTPEADWLALAEAFGRVGARLRQERGSASRVISI